MSIIKFDNQSDRPGSLLQRALEYIKENLAFRNQWIHLQRRGKTPNFLYLTSGARGRKRCDNGLSNVRTIKPSSAEEILDNEQVLNSDALFEPPIISEVAGHDAENDLVNVCPVSQDIPHMIKWTIVEPSDSCSGEIQGVAAATCGSEDESVHEKGLKETVSSSKKSHRNRGVRVHEQDRRDQMPLPFE